MKIALLQYDIAWKNAVENVRILRELIPQAVLEGARLIILPEMFACGFCFPTGDRARSIFASGHQLMLELARSHDVWIAGSLPEAPLDEEEVKNTLLLCGPQGELGRYSKIHLFSYGGEAESCSSGDALFTAKIEDLRVSFFICYDLRFPQIFSAVAEQTDLYVVVANWPAVRRPHWDTLLRARAIENQAYVAGVNRTGKGGMLTYNGGSTVISPKGEILAEGRLGQEIIYAKIEPNEVKEYREEFPVLRDRRWELYETFIPRAQEGEKGEENEDGEGEK